MPKLTTTVEFEVYCGTCGGGLCRQSDNHEGRSRWRVEVEACPHCIGRAHLEGYEEGLAAKECD
jgi:hypothetical protein